jgi:hypothetical protein
LDDWSGAYCEIAASTAYEVVVDYTFGDIDEYVTAVHADLQLEYPGIEILVSAQETTSGETILSITFLDWSEEEVPALDDLLSAAETVATGSNANNVVSGPVGWDDSDQQEASASTPSVPEIVMVATLAATIVMFRN